MVIAKTAPLHLPNKARFHHEWEEPKGQATSPGGMRLADINDLSWGIGRLRRWQPSVSGLGLVRQRGQGVSGRRRKKVISSAGGAPSRTYFQMNRRTGQVFGQG